MSTLIGTQGDLALKLSTPEWRPWWLRRRVVGTFTAIYLLFAIGIAALTIYSAAHDGLTEQDTSKWREYGWKFGPTAVLVVVSAVSSRVELQALKYTPWIRPANCYRQFHTDCECEALLSLDYTHTFSPHALARSLKRRHWFPAIALLVTMLLRISIALSTSLLTLAPKTASVEIPVRVLDTFSPVKFGGDQSDPDEFDDYRPFYISKAVHDLDISYPFGLRQDIAFQIFEAMENDRATGAGLQTSSNITIKAVVEGLTVDLHYERSPSCDEPLPPNSKLGAHKIEFPSCKRPLEQMFGLEFNPYESDTNIAWKYAASNDAYEGLADVMVGRTLWEGLGNCTSLPHQSSYFLLWTGILSQKQLPQKTPEGLDADDIRSIRRCSAVLCAPKITISPVAVTRTGAIISVEPLDGAQSRPLLADIEPLVRLGVAPMRGGGICHRVP
jgi:hypothetical protein